MNTLTNRKLMQYLLLKKSTSTSVILSIFMLPFALIYTRGIFGWFTSIFILILSLIPISLIAVLFGGIYWFDIPFLICYAIVGFWYFTFAITDASRVNEKILHELRYDTCIDNITNNGQR